MSIVKKYSEYLDDINVNYTSFFTKAKDYSYRDREVRNFSPIPSGLATTAYQKITTSSDYEVKYFIENNTSKNNILSSIESSQIIDQASIVESIPTKPTEVNKNPTEGNINHINWFLLYLHKPLTADVSVSYQTRDGSAIASSDYVATSGTANIAAGDTYTTIGVEIISDNLSEGNETFYLVISNPQGITFPVGTIEISAMHTIMDDDDTTAPIVLTLNPADGATGVAVDSNIVLTFSEVIQKGIGTIYLRSGSSTGTVVESFSVADSNRIIVSESKLIIDPTTNLSNNTQYFVTIDSGVVKDIAGNSYLGASTYDFNTVASDTNSWSHSINYHENRADGGYAWDVKYDLAFDGHNFNVITRIDINGFTPSENIISQWERGIENLWNTFSLASVLNYFPVIFDVQFVEDGHNEHYDVNVINSYGRSNMTNWYLDSNWGIDYRDEIAAHEYGHMIGMFDEYQGGATYNSKVTSGTLMSDLTHNLQTNYLFGIEYYAEYYSNDDYSIIKLSGSPENYSNMDYMNT